MRLQSSETASRERDRQRRLEHAALMEQLRRAEARESRAKAQMSEMSKTIRALGSVVAAMSKRLNVMEMDAIGRERETRQRGEEEAQLRRTQTEGIHESMRMLAVQNDRLQAAVEGQAALVAKGQERHRLPTSPAQGLRQIRRAITGRPGDEGAVRFCCP
jgi:chromosome segregation ATPase